MQYSLMAQTTKTGMAMYNLNPLADGDIAKYGEEGEDGWERRLAIDDKEGNVVNLEPVGQVSYACPASVGMCDDNDLVPSIDEFLGQSV